MTDQERQPKAPRGSEEEPWNHPADGGESIGGGDFWHHQEAVGYFQDSDEFPDDVAQAMRAVYERMYRAGVRDWELEWDYVECAYWHLRRNLEVIAREVFRAWFGINDWRAPFARACSRQAAMEVEYRIDDLLTSEFGVEVRKREAPPGRSPRVPYGTKKQIVLGHYREALKGGPLHAQHLAKRISELSGATVTHNDVYTNLKLAKLVAVTRSRNGKGQPIDLLSLP